MPYWIIDAICHLTALFYVFSSLLQFNLQHIVYALFLFFTYPLALESIANVWAKSKPLHIYSQTTQSKFVYHRSYSMNLWGFEKQHPFDSYKYGRVYTKMVEKQLLPYGVIQPEIIPRSLLIEKMKMSYLFKLNYSLYLSRILEVPYWWLPNWIFRWRVLDPMLRATQGSILAALAALKWGWAVNLSGGFHHGSYGQGGGFCVYPDISFIVHYLQTRTMVRRIMIIDLDAHQGDGFERDLIINDNVYIVDCYNSKIYPQDHESKDAIMKTILVTPNTSNQDYLKQVSSLEQDFQFYQPQFVIYNAGTDVLESDPIGKLSMTKETVIRRDQKVLELSRSRGVPVVMLLSGGYQDLSAEVIGDSLQNLCCKFG